MKLKNNRVSTIFLIIVLLISNCDFTMLKTNISGKYIFNKGVNNIDSLIIYNNGKYTQKIYIANNKKLIYEGRGTWEYNYSGISFDDFLFRYYSIPNSMNKIEVNVCSFISFENIWKNKTEY